jgi:hypothetical protein
MAAESYLAIGNSVLLTSLWLVSCPHLALVKSGKYSLYLGCRISSWELEEITEEEEGVSIDSQLALYHTMIFFCEFCY